MYTGEEYQLRLGIWLANQRAVQEHNSGSHSYTLTMNKFAALTPSEYRSLLGYRAKANSKGYNVRRTAPSNADSLDWREQGCVVGVKDQGFCGACWAFSAIQAIESCWAIKHDKELVALSESMLVDCDTYDNGCNGGLMGEAFQFIVSEHGGKVMTEADYPYAGKVKTCAYDDSKALWRMSTYLDIERGDEGDLQAKVEERGPCAVSIDASSFSFQLYFGGIYDNSSCSSTNLDHGVGCVGFGVNGDKQFWIVKNSWGTWWGESGYIRIIKGKNMCGIASVASVPVVE